MGNILLGTCSWTDRTLIQCGRFYPPWATSAEARLRYYASQFPVVEVDSTYYALPSRRNSELWVERTPGDFLFHIKAFALFTHHPTPPSALPPDLRQQLPDGLSQKRNLYLRDLSADLLEELWRRFNDALLPLDSAGRLGLVLLQFPRWFPPGREARTYLLQCQERLGQYRAAVEFRNATWLREERQQELLDWLRHHHLTFVSVDEPQGYASSVPPVAEATTELAYVRFHGRNQETWERRGAAASERFNYWYVDQELQEWVPKIRQLREKAQQVHLLFNTNYQDQGVVNARMMASLLEQEERP